jgi:hypothetical protein
MTAHRDSLSLTAGVVYDVHFVSRDLGYGEEDGQFRGYWTGEIDTWGKHTFRPVGTGPIRYLFRDELQDLRRCGVEGNR